MDVIRNSKYEELLSEMISIIEKLKKNSKPLQYTFSNNL